MEKHYSILIISALDIWSMGKSKGGPALYNTIVGYARMGWVVYFVTANRQGENDFDKNISKNIHIMRFDAPLLKQLMSIRKIGFFVGVIWWIYFQIAVLIYALKVRLRTKIDVVYGYEVYGVPIAKVLSKLWRIPMVSRFQGTSFGVGWKNKKFRLLRAWKHFIGLKIPADLVIMTNDGTQGDKVLKNLGVDMKRVRFLMNGVDWGNFSSLPPKKEAKKIISVGDRFVLLTVSRLEKWKHVDRSIKALPNVIKKFPNVLLIIVGDGSERRALEELALKLKVSEFVRFEGAIPHDEVSKYFAAADIFLSFYDWSNVGNPLLEAMMSGKCIITLNNGDTSRFIKNGVNGILLEYEELYKLSEVIIKLISDREHRKRLGTNAMKFAKEHFWSWDERIDFEIREVEALLRSTR